MLCPGGFGTLDETMEVLTLIQTGKSPLVPVVLMDQPGGSYWAEALTFVRHQLQENRYILPTDLRLIRLVDSAEAAAEEIATFYGNYHSSRWLKDLFAIRMNRRLTEGALAALDERFADLCLQDGFRQVAGADAEQDEPELQTLPRLIFMFNGRDHGRLRELVDFINLPQNWAQ